jgi:hypothetical protein
MPTNPSFSLTGNELHHIKSQADGMMKEMYDGKSVNQIILEHLKGDFPDRADEECQRIVEAIVQNSSMFSEKMETVDNEPDYVRNAIVEMIKDMPAEDALKFLKAWSYVREISASPAIKQALMGENDIELSEIENAIMQRLEANEGLSEAEQIDILIDNISSDEMDVLTMIGGNGEFLEMLKGRVENPGSLISDYTKNKVNSAGEKAFLSYVVYSEAQKGSLSGVPSDVDPAVATIFVNAGIEKARVMEALAKGEIDEEEALGLLEIIGIVTELLLAFAIYTTVALSVAAVSAGVLVSFFAIGPVTAYICLVTGLLLGFKTADLVADDIFEAVEDFCNFTYKRILLPAGNFVKKLFTKAKDCFRKNPAELPSN